MRQMTRQELRQRSDVQMMARARRLEARKIWELQLSNLRADYASVHYAVRRGYITRKQEDILLYSVCRPGRKRAGTTIGALCGLASAATKRKRPGSTATARLAWNMADKIMTTMSR